MFSGTLKYDSINLLTGPASDYSTNATVNADGETNVLAKSEDGTMVFVKTAGGSGWVGTDLIDFDGDAEALPVWKDAMEENGAENAVEMVEEPAIDEDVPDVAPVDAVTADDGLSTATVTSASDLKNGPSYAYETLTWIPERANVVVQAQNEAGNWVYVSAEKGGGWLPASKIETADDLTQLPKSAETNEGALYMPRGTVNKARIARRVRPSGDKKTMLGTLDQGAEVRLIGRNGNSKWVFVMVDGGDGWVPTQHLDMLDAADVTKVSLWAEATGTNRGA